MKRHWKVLLMLASAVVAIVAFLGYRALQPPFEFLGNLEPTIVRNLTGDVELRTYAVSGTTDQWQAKIDSELLSKGFKKARLMLAKPRSLEWGTPPPSPKEPSDVAVTLSENYGGRPPGTHTLTIRRRTRGLMGWVSRTWWSMLNDG